MTLRSSELPLSLPCVAEKIQHSGTTIQVPLVLFAVCGPILVSLQLSMLTFGISQYLSLSTIIAQETRRHLQGDFGRLPLFCLPLSMTLTPI